jgi:hypothetical protein
MHAAPADRARLLISSSNSRLCTGASDRKDASCKHVQLSKTSRKTKKVCANSTGIFSCLRGDARCVHSGHAPALNSWCCYKTGMYDKDVDRWRKRQMEDELRDPGNFLE